MTTVSLRHTAPDEGTLGRSPPRHRFDKHTLDAGADLVSAATLLGRQRLETTAIYTTLSARDLEKAVEKLAVAAGDP